MNKTSKKYQFLTALKHIIFTTIICLVMCFFLIPINSAYEWTIWFSQIILIGLFVVSIYVPFWEFGYNDRNYVNINKKKEDILQGTKIGFLISIPYFVTSFLMILVRLNVVKWLSYLFLVFNSYFYYFIDSMIAKPDPALTPWWIIAVFVVMPLFIPFVSSIGYVLGYKEISIKEKLLYKKVMSEDKK